MAEISQAARDYLTALEKKRQVARARGGSEADAALVASQKAEADKLESKKPGGAMTIANRERMEEAARARLRGSVKKDGPSSKFDKNKKYSMKAEDGSLVAPSFYPKKEDKSAAVLKPTRGNAKSNPTRKPASNNKKKPSPMIGNSSGRPMK